MKKKVIIYVPGLNDSKFPYKQLANLLPIIWNWYGYPFYIVRPQWSTGTFVNKLKQIINMIDDLYSQDYDIYLFGQSAGGAAVFNAYVERKQKVKKVVDITGRLQKGQNVFPSLQLAARGNPAFAESVLLFENINREKLTKEDKKNMLIIRPLFDQIVPKSTVLLEGVQTVTLPLIGHSFGGIGALTLFSKNIRTFLI